MATANLLQTSVSGGTQNALSLQGDGVFFPKASTASRLALTLTTTDKGFIVYDTTDNNIYFWNGAAWESVPSSGDAGANGSVQYNDNGIVSGATNFVWDKVNGRVGINTATPGYPLEVVGNAVFSADATCKRFFVSDTTGNGNVYINGANGSQSLINLGGQTNYNIGAIIYDDASNFLAFRTNSVEAARFNSTGNLVLKGGTAAANGVGITFPVTPVASSDANCLDDYEEGAWSPTVSGEVNLTSTTFVSARYTKIGRVVTVSGSVTTFIITSNTLAYFALQNLPFAPATIVPGPLWNDTRNTSGTTQVAGTVLYGFLSAASGTTSGSAMILNFSNTYTV